MSLCSFKKCLLLFSPVLAACLAWLPTCMCTQSLQSFLTLWDPVDCSLPGSSVLGYSPGVGCLAFLKGIFPTQGLKLNPRCLPRRQAGSSPRAPLGAQWWPAMTQQLSQKENPNQQKSWCWDRSSAAWTRSPTHCWVVGGTGQTRGTCLSRICWDVCAECERGWFSKRYMWCYRRLCNLKSCRIGLSFTSRASLAARW